MLSTAGKASRHCNPSLFECCLGYVTQECLVKRLQGLVGIGEHIPSGSFAFINAEVVVAVYQTSCQAGEEDADFKVWHICVLFKDAVFIGVAIQKQQPVFLAKGDTALVQDAVIQSDILALCLRGYLHYFKRLQCDAIRLGKCHYISNQNSSR